MHLSWDIDEYTILVKNPNKGPEDPRKKIPKTVVSKIKGQAEKGDFIAIMGPSGAGKTTLLSLLSDRVTPKTGEVLKRQVKLNGQDLNIKNFGKSAAYVMQDDRLFPTLTPRESIEFVVNLRMNGPSYEKQDKVDEIIAELGLIKCSDTLVGDAKRKGLSGGERKRVSVAVELVTDPDVIFLDEPTSGLDTITAFRICKALRKLADMGKIVICTIHQPTAEAFFLFDKLVLLSKGRLMYQGATKDSVGYFSSIGYKCPEFLNPIEYFMKIIQPQGNVGEASKQYRQLVTAYEDQVKAQEAASSNELKYSPTPKKKHADDQVPGLTTLYYLTKRATLNLKRDTGTLGSQAFSTILFALMMLAVFYGKSDTKADVSDKNGLFLFITINSFMSTVQGTLMSFPQERDVFLKENSSRLYGVVPYFLAKNLPEIPFQLISPTISAIILYHACGLRDDGGHFLWFIIINILISLSGVSFGFMISCAINDPEMATTVGTLSLLPLMIVGGYYANADDLGPWISWLQYFSPLRYAFEAMVRNEFEDRRVCTDTPQGCDPVEDYGLDFGFAACVSALLAMSVGYRLVALIALKLKTKTVG